LWGVYSCGVEGIGGWRNGIRASREKGLGR
jgi:hypothetical protein